MKTCKTRKRGVGGDLNTKQNIQPRKREKKKGDRETERQREEADFSVYRLLFISVRLLCRNFPELLFPEMSSVTNTNDAHLRVISTQPDRRNTQVSSFFCLCFNPSFILPLFSPSHLFNLIGRSSTFPSFHPKCIYS
jgi:hypothetical protein